MGRRKDAPACTTVWPMWTLDVGGRGPLPTAATFFRWCGRCFATRPYYQPSEFLYCRRDLVIPSAEPVPGRKDEAGPGPALADPLPARPQGREAPDDLGARPALLRFAGDAGGLARLRERPEEARRGVLQRS